MARDLDQLTDDEKTQIRAKERQLLDGIKAALDPSKRPTEVVPIKGKDGNVLFEIEVRGLTDDERQECDRLSRDLVQSPVTGTMVPGELQIGTFSAWMIYKATVSTIGGQNVWDHEEIRAAADNAVTPQAAIGKLLSGNKDEIVGVIQRLSGFKNAARRTLGN